MTLTNSGVRAFGLGFMLLSSTLMAQTGATWSLDQAMDAAEKHSFGSRITKLSETAAELRRDQALGGRGPKVTVDAQQIWVDKSVNKLAGETLPNGLYFPDKVSTAGVQITQPITAALVSNERAELEQKLTDASHQDVIASQLDARQRGAEAFIRLLKARKLLTVAQTSRQVIDAQRKDALAQKNQGRLADLDIRRLDLAAAEADLALIDARSQVKLSVTQFSEVTGVEISAEQPLADIKAQNAATAVNFNFNQRAEYQGASIRSEAAARAKEISRYDYFPGANLFVRYERDFNAKEIPPPVSFDKDEIQDKLSYGVQVQWTIWDWNQRRARSRELIQEAEKSSVNAELVASQIRLEQRQVGEELARTQNALTVAEQAEHLANQVYDAIAKKFKNGLATTFDLLTAERDRSRAQANFAVANYDLVLAQVKAKRAQGVRP